MPRKLISANCQRCAETFQADPWKVAHGRAKFCSRACLTHQETRVCPTCGKNFAVKRCEAKRGWGRWCSVPCRWASKTPSALLWAKVVKTDCCWLWFGQAIGRDGYGKLKLDAHWRGHHGRTVAAHRLSYELAYGSIPEGMIVRHTCDVKKCVRPDHLLLGSNLDNVNDYLTRGQFQPGCCAPAITWL